MPTDQFAIFNDHPISDILCWNNNFLTETQLQGWNVIAHASMEGFVRVSDIIHPDALWSSAGWGKAHLNSDIGSVGVRRCNPFDEETQRIPRLLKC
jgi:hypothetical protein